MKSNLLKRIMILTIIITTLITVLSISASAAWKQDSKGWWNTEGDSYSVGWRQIDSKWCYFDQSGYMVHNTIIDGYYLDSKGIAIATIKGDIPIRIPSDWIQTDKLKAISYAIDAKSDFIYDTTDIYGGSESIFINGMKYGISKVSSESEVSEKNYKGKNATCIQYTLSTESGNKKAYSVLFFKNDKVHCFNVVSSIDDFDNAKQQLEDMLNLSLEL